MKKIYILTLVLALLVGITNASENPTRPGRPTGKPQTALKGGSSIGGIYSKLTLTEGTYTLDSSMVVTDSLIVKPGVTVKATDNYYIEIAGVMICNGTDPKPITFSRISFLKPVTIASATIITAKPREILPTAIFTIGREIILLSLPEKTILLAISNS